MLTRKKSDEWDSGDWSLDHESHLPTKLVERLGGSYSADLGIRLASMESDEVFKWFVTSVLLGSTLGEDMAMNVYRRLEKARVNSIDILARIGPLDLVNIVQQGGYEALDMRTAKRLLHAAGSLKQDYQGDLNRLHFFAEDERDLERRLRGLAMGIGPVTLYIFLRELRGLWDKAAPRLSDAALLASNNLGLGQEGDATCALERLRMLWDTDEQDETHFGDFEVALEKLGTRYCRRKRCSACPMRPECRTSDTSPERENLTRR